MIQSHDAKNESTQREREQIKREGREGRGRKRLR